MRAYQYQTRLQKAWNKLQNDFALKKKIISIFNDARLSVSEEIAKSMKQIAKCFRSE